MYRKLYQDRKVPENHQNYSLITHDIQGAQPKAWHDDVKPFFHPADANLHIHNQKAQYQDSLNNELTLKEQNDRYSHHRKHFESNAATNSEIASEKIFQNQKADEEAKKAKGVFYPRNLQVDDIEGCKPGTLISKGVKNKNLAHALGDLHERGSHARISHARGHSGGISLNYPYGRMGDCDNTVDMPIYLQKARWGKKYIKPKEDYFQRDDFRSSGSKSNHFVPTTGALNNSLDNVRNVGLAGNNNLEKVAQKSTDNLQSRTSSQRNQQKTP